MSSGFSGGLSDLFSSGRRSGVMPSGGYSGYGSNLNQQQQFCYRSPLAGVVADPGVQIRRPDLIGKRSLVEFQQQQGLLQQNQGLGFYLRNVKPRPNYERTSPVSTLSPIDLSVVSSISPEVSSISSVSNSMTSRFGCPVVPQSRMQATNVSNGGVRNVFDGIPLPNLAQGKRLGNLGVNVSENSTHESEKNTMNHRLQELEKQLLDDEEDGEGVSAVCSSEWSETIQNLIGPVSKPVSPSPTSSSSSCSSTSASPPVPCTKQALIDAATAIADGKTETAAEILTLLQPVANTKGTPEQRLAAYMISALKSRVYPTQHPPAVAELYGDDHAESIHMLYEVSPCFELAFMAANLAILEATTEPGFERIHILDFDVGSGRQYVHLLHALAATKKLDNKTTVALKITAFAGDEKKLQTVGDYLAALAAGIGVPFDFEERNLDIADLCREKLNILPGDALAVNFAFKLYKLPDESVTTENLRDDLLRRVKYLSPAAITVVEQDINTNTAPLIARARDACEHYGTLFESLDAAVGRDSLTRLRIEAAIGRKLSNAVACEGVDRVERCEVYGKWRARMRMAGFHPRAMTQPAAESLRSKLNSLTRGSTGFTMKEDSGGICFGWMGRTLTVASAWR